MLVKFAIWKCNAFDWIRVQSFSMRAAHFTFPRLTFTGAVTRVYFACLYLSPSTSRLLYFQTQTLMPLPISSPLQCLIEQVSKTSSTHHIQYLFNSMVFAQEPLQSRVSLRCSDLSSSHTMFHVICIWCSKQKRQNQLTTRV